MASVRYEIIFIAAFVAILLVLIKCNSDNVIDDYTLKHTMYEDSIVIASQRKIIAEANSDAAKQAQQIAELEVKVKNASED